MGGSCGRGEGWLSGRKELHVCTESKCITPPLISSFYVSLFFIYVRCLYYILIDTDTFILIPYILGEHTDIIIVVYM